MRPENLYEEIIELKNSGEPHVWSVLSNKYGETRDALRSWFARESKKRDALGVLLESEDDDVEEPSLDTAPEKDFKAEKETKFDDSGNVKAITSKRLIEMNEEQEKDPKFVLKAHGFNPDEWIVVTLINNFWQGMRKNDKGALTLYQSKLTVKPRKESNTLSLEDIEYFFANTDMSTDALNLQVYNSTSSMGGYDGEGKTVIINLADAHFGNEDVNYPTRQKVYNLIRTVIDKSRCIKVKKFMFISLGDLLHIDGEDGTTTAGTQVGERGTYFQIWEDAVKALILSIKELARVAPVEFIGISGNHDRTSSFSACKAVEYALQGEKNIVCDTDFSHRKYRVVGDTIFGIVHGDLPQKNVATLLQREAREEYGMTHYAYILQGHVHHINIKDNDGVIVSSLPSITKTDYWHESQAYVGAWKGTYVYVVDDVNSIEETWHIQP